MGNIAEYLRTLRTAVFGKDVRESIAQSIEQTYEDATRSGNANMEVSDARGYYSSLKNRLDGDKNDLQSQINGLASGSPLVASSVSGMTNTNRVYVNTTDGHWYTYNGSTWVDGGVYQATEIASGSVKEEHLNDYVKNDIYRKTILSDLINKNNSQYRITLAECDLLNGKYLKDDGDFMSVNHTKNLLTNFIPLPYNINLIITSALENINKYKISFYDLNKQHILQYRGSDINGLIKFVPYNASYVVVQATRDSDFDNYANYINQLNISVRTKQQILRPHKNLVNENNCVNGFLLNGLNIQNLEDWKTTELIQVNSGIIYISQLRSFSLVSANGNITHTHLNDIATDYYIEVDENIKYIIFAFRKNHKPMMCYVEDRNTIPKYEAYKICCDVPFFYEKEEETDGSLEFLKKTNPLYGKKYVSLGDSFTHGDFTNSPTNDYTFTSGLYAGENKVYPFYIGNRNNMSIINLAQNGMTLTNINGSSNNWLSDSILSNIPRDADYITIKVGINDDTSHQNAPLGTIDSNDSTTFYGSFNRVMTYLINNFKNAKIGIIVSNGISNINYVNATINIAKKYGVSYLNETTDEKVPLLIRTLRSDVDSSIKQIRNNEWSVSTIQGATNGHPNAKCHEYESTIVENWLRTL